MRTALFSMIFFYLLNESCTNSNAVTPPLDPASEKFSLYLKINFDDSIPEKHHYFILIAKKDSRENVETILERIDPYFKNKKTGSYSSIISVNMPVADSLILPGKNHTDWDAALDKFNLNLSGVTIIETENHRILNTVPLFLESSGNEQLILK